MIRSGHRVRRFARVAIVTSALVGASTVSGAQAPARLLPVDEAAARPDFFSFRAQLQEAVARHGYVASRLARSPLDYRAIFTRAAGRWQLTMFLAGD
jgi:hypothetical protein